MLSSRHILARSLSTDLLVNVTKNKSTGRINTVRFGKDIPEPFITSCNIGCRTKRFYIVVTAEKSEECQNCEAAKPEEETIGFVEQNKCCRTYRKPADIMLYLIHRGVFPVMIPAAGLGPVRPPCRKLG